MICTRQIAFLRNINLSSDNMSNLVILVLNRYICLNISINMEFMRYINDDDKC